MLVLHCSVCNDVNQFGVEGNTVFEMNGRFLQVLVYRVELAGVNNPSGSYLFSRYTISGAHEHKRAFLVIEMLLDHLSRRGNATVHVALKLIPRFGTSNPSPSYIRSVKLGVQ